MYTQTETPSSCRKSYNKLNHHRQKKKFTIFFFSFCFSFSFLSMLCMCVRPPRPVRPLWVKMDGKNKPLSAGRDYELLCEVVGSRPPPKITWWKGSERLTSSTDKVRISCRCTNLWSFFFNSKGESTYTFKLICMIEFCVWNGSYVLTRAAVNTIYYSFCKAKNGNIYYLYARVNWNKFCMQHRTK